MSTETFDSFKSNTNNCIAVSLEEFHSNFRHVAVVFAVLNKQNEKTLFLLTPFHMCLKKVFLVSYRATIIYLTLCRHRFVISLFAVYATRRLLVFGSLPRDSHLCGTL
jgi:hypothetical protein